MNWKELHRIGQFGTPWLVNLLLKKKTQEEEEEEGVWLTCFVIIWSQRVLLFPAQYGLVSGIND